MENGYKLDETDIRILQELQKNSQLTVKELASKVHLSPSPTFERQKRLEREGYITRYMAVVDAKKVGNGIMVLCNIRLKQHSLAWIFAFSMDTAKKTLEKFQHYELWFRRILAILFIISGILFILEYYFEH